MQSLVSILIPAYNSERWIADTIRSALAQTWRRKEIIVVDDGSVDQTLAVAQRFACEIVIVVTQPNLGAAAARNKAYSICQGDYIQWLDADDVLASDKIEKQMQRLQRDGTIRTLWSGSWGHCFTNTAKAKFAPTSLWTDLPPIEWLLKNLGEGVFMQTGSWLTPRNLAEKAGQWDVTLVNDDDGEYFARVVRESEAVCFVPDARTFYRRIGGNRVSNVGLSNAKLDAHFRSMKLQILNIRSVEESQRVHAACLRYLQNSMSEFYPERPDIVEELQEIAADLGGQLDMPQASWKYAAIQKVFGWPAAKRTQVYYNRCKSFLLRTCDSALSRGGG